MKFIKFSFLCLFLLFLSNCGSSKKTTTVYPGEQPSNAKLLTSYSINNVIASITGNYVNLTLPYKTDLTNLVAVFKTTGVKVEVNGIQQTSGVTQNDFTEPVIYSITAEDNSSNYYIVKVATALSYDKEFTLFSIPNQLGTTTINNTDGSINLIMPFDSDLTNLIATFNIKGKNVFIGDVLQTSGQTVNDFTNPLSYKIVAYDGSTKTYTVKVSLSASINSFSNVIKIVNSTSSNGFKTVKLAFSPNPSQELLTYDFNDFLYCVNIKEYPSATNIYENLDLIEYDTFNCTGGWKTYYELPRTLDVYSGKEYILNILVSYNNKTYLYNRIYIRPNFELLDAELNCDELIASFSNNNSIVLMSDVDCTDNTIASKNQTFSNLYFNGNGFKISNANIFSVLDYAGLIGKLTSNSYISNLELNNFVVKGRLNVGSLSGDISHTAIENILSSSAITEVSTQSGEIGGLLGSADYAFINNSEVATQITVINNSNAGGFIGSTHENTIILNSKSTGTLNGVLNVGGFIGVASYLNIKNCISNTNVLSSEAETNGEYGAGGFIGLLMYSNVRNSYSTGDVIGISNNRVGGFIGTSTESIINSSYSTGDVLGTGLYTGGFISIINSSQIYDSYSTGAVTSQTSYYNNPQIYTGGFAAVVSSSTITNSYSTSEVLSSPYLNSFNGVTYSFTGGLIGLSSSLIISNSHYYGTLKGNFDNSDNSIGGLIGKAYDTNISDSYTDSIIQISPGGARAYTGALVGSLSSCSITRSYSKGNIDATGGGWAGGLVGWQGESTSTIQYCYSNANVVTNSSAGGLIGYAAGLQLSNSYATGTVQGSYDVGGLIGSINNSSVNKTYATGLVLGTSNVKGLIGIYNSLNKADNYCVQSNCVNEQGITKLTQEQFGLEASFTNYDFTNTWLMQDGVEPDFRRPHLLFEN